MLIAVVSSRVPTLIFLQETRIVRFRRKLRHADWVIWGGKRLLHDGLIGDVVENS